MTRVNTTANICLLVSVLGLRFLVHVEVLEREAELAQELVPAQVAPVQHLQHHLRPVAVLRDLPARQKYFQATVKIFLYVGTLLRCRFQNGHIFC